MAHFVLASGNRHKLAEFGRILAPHRMTAMPAGITLPPEKTVSFAENARDKAAALAQALAATGQLAGSANAPDVFCLADDSGLEVEALGWAPGVTSSRYRRTRGRRSGQHRQAARCARRARRGGRPQGALRLRARRRRCGPASLRRGRESGGARSRLAPSGNGGFGYDPVFVPEGEEQTVAELPQTRKDRLSHRARAAQALLELLRTEGVPGV